SILDDAPDRRGPLPRVRQDGKHERALGNEQQQRLEAADRALVVEHTVAHPPAERVLSTERLSDRLVEIRPLLAMHKPVLDEVADGPPQAAGGPALDRIRGIRDDAAGQRPPHGVAWRL